MTPTTCPGCSVQFDLDALPSNSRLTSLPGKHCPVCDFPMDDAAVEAKVSHVNDGALRARIVADHRERIAAASKAAAKPAAKASAGGAQP